MMRAIYKKFMPADKEAHVKEFIRLSNTLGTSQRKYAASHEIPISTFKRWLKQYRDFTNSEPAVTAEESDCGSFIMISEDHNAISIPTEYDPARSTQGIRLMYKDAVLEFQPDQLREVMEILRLW